MNDDDDTQGADDAAGEPADGYSAAARGDAPRADDAFVVEWSQPDLGGEG